jgi:Type I restriction enzyme R protein N terminus (HSDR_N)
MFSEIRPEIFNNPDFKEDSVRELILAPMLAKLGYLPTGSTRVIRSKSLKHPFIRIGTRNHPVTVIPDYTLLHDDKPIFILDAKGPNEDIMADANVQQAYSYAMHPEITCREFGLCNGRQLAIFDIYHRTPLLVLNFEEFELRWSEIEKYISPMFLSEPALRQFSPDFGLALVRRGFEKTAELAMFGVRPYLFVRVSQTLITASANWTFGDV